MQNKMNYGAVRNRAGQYVLATPASTTAAVASVIEKLRKNIAAPVVDAPGDGVYPMTGLTYLLIPKHFKTTARERALRDFLQWTMKQGQTLTTDLHLAPLPVSVIHLNKGLLSANQR